MTKLHVLQQPSLDVKDFLATVPDNLTAIIVLGVSDDGNYWKFNEGIKVSTAVLLLEALKARLMKQWIDDEG